MDYSRQMLLGHVGKEGQEKLSKSSVAIVGVGAIGCMASELLARSGIGKLVLIDRDVVDESNIQRQTLFTEADIGKAKAAQAKAALEKINPEVSVTAHVADLDYENAGVLNSNLVLDCTDNMEARFLINEYCVKNRIPWIHSAAIRTSGTVIAFPQEASMPCFRCIFSGQGQSETCDTAGVSNSITAAIAAIQVSEAIKLLLGMQVEQKMVRLDLMSNELLKLSMKKSSSCPVCIGVYDYLSGKKGSTAVKLCGTGSYQIKGKRIDLQLLKQAMEKSAGEIGAMDVKDFGCCLSFGSITIFSDGRALVKAEDEAGARAKYARVVG
ncbi:ThiF family adenylyltransferase [Candidatus Woesearchaeota archaeon]|nr:ThiF family adenylyltransferase [Candidatus Woesearchaeota archaeon]